MEQISSLELLCIPAHLLLPSLISVISPLGLLKKLSLKKLHKWLSEETVLDICATTFR